MILQAYVITDQQSEASTRPFWSVSDGTAIREVRQMMRTDSMLTEHAEDYDLVGIGNYDPFKLELQPHEPHHVVSLQHLKEQKTE